MDVRYVYGISTDSVVPSKTYNPTTYLPITLWERVYRRNELTIKSLIILGWRARQLKECRILSTALLDPIDQDRIIDLISTIRQEKKRVHIKFMSKDYNIALKIYEQHIKHRTTISNYLLYLFLIGLYANSITVIHYSDSTTRRKIAKEDEEILKNITENILRNTLKSKKHVINFKNRIITELLKSKRRTYIKYIKKIDGEYNVDKIIHSIVNNIIFNMRPGTLLRNYVKNCIGYL